MMKFQPKDQIDMVNGVAQLGVAEYFSKYAINTVLDGQLKSISELRELDEFYLFCKNEVQILENLNSYLFRKEILCSNEFKGITSEFILKEFKQKNFQIFREKISAKFSRVMYRIFIRLELYDRFLKSFSNEISNSDWVTKSKQILLKDIDKINSTSQLLQLKYDFQRRLFAGNLSNEYKDFIGLMDTKLSLELNTSEYSSEKLIIQKDKNKVVDLLLLTVHTDDHNIMKAGIYDGVFERAVKSVIKPLSFTKLIKRLKSAGYICNDQSFLIDWISCNFFYNDGEKKNKKTITNYFGDSYKLRKEKHFRVPWLKEIDVED